MRIGRAVGMIVVSAAVCGLCGAGVGAFLGRAVPSYYRTVFRASGPEFDPVEVGTGLGLSQGLVAGLLGGCVLVLATALLNRRRENDPAGGGDKCPGERGGGGGDGGGRSRRRGLVKVFTM